eukprot:365851-Chlamydomonas_euryale.AAC.4
MTAFCTPGGCEGLVAWPHNRQPDSCEVPSSHALLVCILLANSVESSACQWGWSPTIYLWA